MDSIQVNAPRRRRLSLDALRGVAVFLMVEQHVGIWVWRGPDPGRGTFDYPVLVGFNALGGLAAPLFVTLAGVGSALFVASGRAGMDGTLIRRGLVLMGFGLLLNMLSPSWFSWGSWFVLHMMGMAMALGPVWRRLPSWAILAAACAVLVSTPLLQSWLETPAMLTNDRMRDVGLPGGPLRLALAEGQFPIFPWLALYLFGFVSGRAIERDRPGVVAGLAAASLAIGGLGHALFRLELLPFSGELARRYFGLQLSFFPATVSMITLLMGGALLLIAFVVAVEHRRELSSHHPLVTLGRVSLTLLIVHVPLFRDLSRPLGVWHGLSAGAALATIFAFLGLAWWVARRWQRHGFRFSAEWALRRIAG